MGGSSSATGQASGSACGTRPRARIIATACDLFHRFGIRGVGVETIADAAGTNKMTLYRHFGSKDELIVECLQAVADEGLARWQQLETRYPGDPKAQLLAWVRTTADWMDTDGRGCDLANAAVELTEEDHPARKLIERCKRDHRGKLVDLCLAIDPGRGEMLADTLWLLLEGARVSRQSIGPEGPSARFARLSEAVIGAFAG